MTTRSAEILIVTAVWGDWHIRAFLELNLPTLLAPGNFPALFEKHRGSYQIFTRSSDVVRIQSAPTFQQLTALVPVNLQIIEDEGKLNDPIGAHVEIWRQAVVEAAGTGKLALLMPPDVLWSNGSFAHIADLLAQGKRAIYASFARVTSNSFLPAFRSKFRADKDLIALSGSDLVRLCLEHLHPIMAAHSRTSRYFPFHAEMALWAVPNEGLAVRVFAREFLIYDPSRISLNVSQLITGTIPWDELHMVSDSDCLFGVSLTPLGKDASWHRTLSRVTTRDVARWWLDYDSLANDYVASVRVRWHFRPATESLWQQREIGTNLFTRRAALEREALRVIERIFDDKRGRALQTGRLLAVLAVSGKLTRALRGMPRLQTRAVFVFIPEDGVFGRRWPAICAALASAKDGCVERIVRDHVAVAAAPVDLDEIGRLEAFDLDFLSGARRSLKSLRRQPLIGNVVVSKLERASAMLVVCYIRGILGAETLAPPRMSDDPSAAVIS